MFIKGVVVASGREDVEDPKDDKLNQKPKQVVEKGDALSACECTDQEMCSCNSWISRQTPLVMKPYE